MGLRLYVGCSDEWFFATLKIKKKFCRTFLGVQRSGKRQNPQKWFWLKRGSVDIS
jgi:hypothetical protein